MCSKKKERPNLYIVGFMGTGKSSVGRLVADCLGMIFIDSDREIENSVGRTISQIFEKSGEATFRKLERDFIVEGHPNSGCVVACGGGMITQSELPELLIRKGVVVCLYASVETILQRTSNNQTRPLLNTSDPENRIKNLILEREDAYGSFNVKISTDDLDIQEVAACVSEVYSDQIKS
ncbi:MAG: shikimate kinase [Rhodospirillaceae bacterium]|uniref:Shikimate kinase n=1 Tax=Candidatus Moanibacter tarae TaxID=2200854 RepID=A0A2Z4ACP0_9BACT|nr:MAG: Shikimate kinase 1 [Candidatus Moanabacter tarae]MBH66944.1 shikimate kinase [Rhodospirillaceae bacterium]|tara:strand:- start:5884 stop:6420 length:537 start_codon:yes stop_codon:yes gene_type:complete